MLRKTKIFEITWMFDIKIKYKHLTIIVAVLSWDLGLISFSKSESEIKLGTHIV